jgi:predicted nucleotidyltransferase
VKSKKAKISRRDSRAKMPRQNRVLKLVEKRQDMLKQLGVKQLGLFGSFARGDQRADSDVDFLVEFEPEKKSFDNFMRLAFFLEDLLKRKVELVTQESLSPYIRPHIIGEVQYVAFTA